MAGSLFEDSADGREKEKLFKDMIGEVVEEKVKGAFDSLFTVEDDGGEGGEGDGGATGDNGGGDGGDGDRERKPKPAQPSFLKTLFGS